VIGWFSRASNPQKSKKLQCHDASIQDWFALFEVLAFLAKRWYGYNVLLQSRNKMQTGYAKSSLKCALPFCSAIPEASVETAERVMVLSLKS
jgi:hypothetical protein